MELYFSFIAALPFVLVIYLMLFRRKSALFSLFITYLLSLVIILFIWKVSLNIAFASFLKGIFLAIEIMLIIFGAIILLGIYKETGKIKIINKFLSNISSDPRIQVILIAWFFVSFIEGVAGFGTPVALAAPLLVSLGFSPIGSVIVSLIGDSTAVSFGAAGTPIILGLEALSLSHQSIIDISIYTALFHLLIGTFIPLVLLYFVVFVIPKKKQDSKKFYEMIPFALICGLSFTIPSLITVIFFGPELPSIIGSLFGFFVVYILIKNKIFIPNSALSKDKNNKNEKSKIFFTFSPYMLLIFLLFISRTLPDVKNFLKNLDLTYGSIFGTNISYTFLPFFTPSIFFLIAIIYSLFAFKINFKHIKGVFVNGFERVERPFISLMFALAFVQLLIISGENFSGLSALPLVLADSLTKLAGEFFIIFSPIVGLLGAFITGSNTVSNVLFGALQNGAAMSIGAGVALILSLQVLGGAVGNMVAIHNVLAAEATVKLHGKEGEIIRKTIVIALIYALLAGITGFLIFLLNK